MIIANSPSGIHESLSAHRVGNDIVKAKVARISVDLDICYDEEHSHLIKDLIKAMTAIMGVEGRRNPPSETEPPFGERPPVCSCGCELVDGVCPVGHKPQRADDMAQEVGLV